MSSLKVLSTQWERPQTSVYENNYGYAVNFYQPMIDYLDEKREKGNAKYPHLPYTNERALPPYDPSRKIKTYTDSEIQELSKGTDRFTRKGLVSMGTKRTSLKKSMSNADVQKSDFDFETQRFGTVSRGNLQKSASTVEMTGNNEEFSKVVVRRRIVQKVDVGKRSSKNLEKIQEYTDGDKEFLTELAKRSGNLKKISENLEASRRDDQFLAELGKRSSQNLQKIQDITGNSAPEKNYLRGKSARAIEAQLLQQTERNLEEDKREQLKRSSSAHELRRDFTMMVERKMKETELDAGLLEPLERVRQDLVGFCQRNFAQATDQSKQTSLEIEQLNIRVVEAETRLKTEVQRIKKKLQIHITELELSLDVANKTNIDLQKTIKKQSLQLTEIQAAYDEVQRQLQVTLDQLSVSQRRLQSLTAEIEEVRGNYESLSRAKRQVEQQYEESVARINELTVINVNLASSKSKVEQELSTLAGDYDHVSQELRVSDERYQRVQIDLKSTVECLHEEQERIVKIEAIKKSLEIEIKNLSIRLEEVEANAVVGSRRIISKLEARMRDLELELDEEKRRHAETIKILRKKERTVKEVMIQCEEDQKNISLLQDSLDKTTQKVNIYKRQLQEQEGMSQQSVTRVRRFQRELEAAEDRAENAESNLTLIRAKHRTFVTTSSVPGSQVYLVQESRTTTQE